MKIAKVTANNDERKALRELCLTPSMFIALYSMKVYGVVMDADRKLSRGKLVGMIGVSPATVQNLIYSEMVRSIDNDPGRVRFELSDYGREVLAQVECDCLRLIQAIYWQNKVQNKGSRKVDLENLSSTTDRGSVGGKVSGGIREASAEA